MSRTVIQLNGATLKLADTSVALATAQDVYSCQVTSAAINANSNSQTVPATFCEGESDMPAPTGFELALSWLQDWTDSAGGLSGYAFENDTLPKWFELSLDGGATVVASGQAYVVAGAFGGDAGTPLVTDAVWPLLAKPTITMPAVMAAGARTEAEAEATYQPA